MGKIIKLHNPTLQDTKHLFVLAEQYIKDELLKKEAKKKLKAENNSHKH